MKKIKIFFLLIINLLTIENIFVNTSFASESENLTIYSPSCILMETATGEILYEKNAYEIRYPASTTKIMTAILALENCELTDIATVSHDAIFTVPSSYAHASLKEGEELTIEQLLNVLLIPSANDAANVLAEHISGSVSEFANLMNQKAIEIGCKNTHYVNPNGIHNNKHTSTAYDLALMGKYAMQNSTFRNIVKTTQYTLSATNKYPKADRIFNTSNDLLRLNTSNSSDNYYYSLATGVKTGYTSEAGSCIVASAKKDDLEVIAVILGGGKTDSGLSQRNLDCITLFDYAFDNYEQKTICESGEIIKETSVFGASKETPNLLLKVANDISVFSEKDTELSDIEREIVLNDNLMAPIALGEMVGKVTYKVNGNTYSADLIAGNTVEVSALLSIIFRCLLIVVVLYILYLLLKPKNRKFKSKKGNYKKTSRKHGKGNYRFTVFSNL